MMDSANPETVPSFFERLTARARAVDSLLCVGLDPRAATVDALRAECARLIEATADYALCFKPNSAFFEAHGPEGLLALHDVIASVPDGIPVLLDAKRGDIADTSAAYAAAAFDTLGADAMTISPYVGEAGLAPLLARRQFGVFVLCKTSNPGAGEFQDLRVDGRPLYEVVAEHAQRWNRQDNVGLVVGATYPADMARVRAAAPDLWVLVPGVGAQGGDLDAILAAGLRADGLGLLINVSRGLARADDPRAEAQRLRDRINAGRQAARQRPLAANPLIAELAHALLEAGCVQFGQFTLKSGIVSPFYLDLRRLVSHPSALRLAARAYAARLRSLRYDRLAGIPYAALPIATAVGLETGQPVIYPRREAKDYGTRAAIEGVFEPGETAVVIDDLATTGGTKVEAIEKLTAAGLTVRDVVVLIDREQGAAAALAQAGYTLHAVVTLSELLQAWRAAGAITDARYEEVTRWLREQAARDA